MGAQGGADEMRADFAAFKNIALAEISVDLAGGPGNHGVEALLVIENFSAEGSVGGQIDIDVAILDEALAALFDLIGDGGIEAVEDGHFLTAPKETYSRQHGQRRGGQCRPRRPVESGRSAGPSNVTNFAQ